MNSLRHRARVRGAYWRCQIQCSDATGTTVVLSTQFLIAGIAKALVDDESAVQVAVEKIGLQTVRRLHVAAQDVGKVVGKQGRTARSLRTILGAIGMCQGVHYGLDIVQPASDW